jgi:superfamily I DNA/RNA helicase
MAKRSFYVKESELDDFQRQVIARRTDSSFIVKGCAGSGKSILALWKVHDLIRNNKGSIQMVVFTKALMSYMEGALEEIGIDADFVDYHHHWERRRSKYLIVDEAQDFSEADIEEFESLAQVLILYGDSAQQLYGWRKDNPPITMEEIEMLTGFPAEKLMFNHRLPQTIGRVAEKISPVPDDLERRCINEGSEKPYILSFRSFEDQLTEIDKIIKNRDFEDVGILLQTNSDVKYAADFFGKRKCAVEAKTRSQMDLNWDSSNPKLLTYHSAKGLQFEAVFVPQLETFRDDVDNRKALYVAMTRSYQSLYIMYSGGLPPVLAPVPKNLYETSLKKEETVLL